MACRRVPDRQCDPEILSKLEVLSSPKIYQLIARGHIIVMANGRVLRLDNWLNHHPGGKLVILHMVGRDATDEING
jgi:sphingolipid 8-(E)-desaturase